MVERDQYRGTYRFFGPPVGAVLEGGAWISAVVLAVLSRKQRRAVSYLALFGAACMVMAQVAWWSCVFPVNAQMETWRPDALPSNFAALRQQWEYTHAGRALLQVLGLGAIVGSVLTEPRGRVLQ